MKRYLNEAEADLIKESIKTNGYTKKHVSENILKLDQSGFSKMLAGKRKSTRIDRKRLRAFFMFTNDQLRD